MKVNNMYLYNKYKDTYGSQELPKKDTSFRADEEGFISNNTDTITISSEALDLLSRFEDLNKYTLVDNNLRKEHPIFDILKEIREQAESQDDPYKDLYRCIIIAMRIVRGDKVPQKDENFLAEKQPEMYLRAILMREEKEDPKEYESLLKDEKPKNPFESISPSESISVSETGDIEVVNE